MIDNLEDLLLRGAVHAYLLNHTNAVSIVCVTAPSQSPTHGTTKKERPRGR